MHDALSSIKVSNVSELSVRAEKATARTDTL
jgi:hypothetical protein